MIKTLSLKLFLMGACITALATGAFGQGGLPDVPQGEGTTPRPNLLQDLGLRQDQVRQIRTMNRDRKPRMEAAQQRLREANRALDIAIYGDSLDEAAVDVRLREFQQAQAEIARIRFESELELRKILTPEQLGTFRMLRARVAENRKALQERRKGPPGERPLQRIRQLPKRQRVN